jgi:NADH:ubiquinone oxidoreductase subunit 6 (subunit J)
MTSEVIFFVLAGLAIVCAALTVSRSKALHSAIFFMLTLLAVAGIFLQLHAPLLFAKQLVLIACLLIGLVFFAVELSHLDVVITAEYRRHSKTAALCAAVGLLLEVIIAWVQHYRYPEQSLTAGLPYAPLGAPLHLTELIRFFFNFDLLPLALVLTILLIATLGLGALFQRRA